MMRAPPQSHRRTSSAKECLSHCTSYRESVHWGWFRALFVLGKVFRRPVQPLTELVADARFDEAVPAPSTDRRRFDAEPFPELLGGQHAGGDEPLFEARKLRGRA